MSYKREKCLVLLSENIFDGINSLPYDGYVAIEGNRIAAVGPARESDEWVKKADKVLSLGSRVVTAGFADSHTFFSGWALCGLGVNFTSVTSDTQGVQAIQQWQRENAGLSFVIGNNWNPETFETTTPGLLDEAFPETPVVIFTFDRDTCWMNEAARKKYKFTPEACWAEMIWRMMPDYLNMPGIEQKYLEYMQMLNSKGVTTIKEMTFDTYYGFDDVMKKLEDNDALTVRVSMMSQPVGAGINIEHGHRMTKKFTGDFVRFSGYNRMTDRGIARSLAELIEPYASNPNSTVAQPVEWELITEETHLADQNGFRYSLHCQGDGAVRKTVELFDTCKKKPNGTLENRHAITDLELTNPQDLERFGKMGGIAEVYAQIQMLDNKQDVMDMIAKQLGTQRGKYYWNRRKMWDAGICVCGATDLPLLIPNIPEAIYCGCGGYFNDGESFNEENMLTVAQMLTAWTKNGQYNCYNEDRLGTLEAGKLADIAVLDTDVFTVTAKRAKDAKVCLTISDGRIVHNTL